MSLPVTGQGTSVSKHWVSPLVGFRLGPHWKTQKPPLLPLLTRVFNTRKVPGWASPASSPRNSAAPFLPAGGRPAQPPAWAVTGHPKDGLFYSGRHTLFPYLYSEQNFWEVLTRCLHLDVGSSKEGVTSVCLLYWHTTATLLLTLWVTM